MDPFTADRRFDEALDYAESIIDAVREPLIVLDKDLLVDRANRAFYQTFRVSQEETLRCPIYDLGNGQWNIPQLRTLLEDILPHNSSFNDFEVEHDFPAIGKKVMLLNARKLYRPTNHTTMILLAIEDVSERKRLEAALRERSDRLAEADRRKDEFLAMLSHELRNPLAPLRNAVEILRQDPAAGELQRQTWGIIDRQVRLMGRLVDDLLEISRVSSGKLHLSKERVDLREVIANAVETARPLTESRKHELALVVAGEPVWVDADPIRLQQVILNLLNNAARYTEVGGRIGLDAGVEAGRAQVSVQDTGIGIAPESLPHVFDLFAQSAGAVDRSKEGLGIGLALVRSLVELHGGTVEARSAGVGRGSQFVVRLPLAPGPHQRVAKQAREEKEVEPLRILIVDDNVDAAESLAVLLRLSGHQVQTAYIGLTALQAVATFAPRVVLLDIGLPGMDGYEVARRLRQQPRTCKMTLVAVTGYGGESEHQRSREAGFEGHLVKPVDPDALRRLLRDVCDDAL